MGRWNCCVPECTNFKEQKNSPVSLTWHCFPKDKILRKQWLVKIKRDIGRDFNITSNTRICSAHFTPDDFRPHLHSRLHLLKKNAVPSLFAWTNSQRIDSSLRRTNRCRTRSAKKQSASTCERISSFEGANKHGTDTIMPEISSRTCLQDEFIAVESLLSLSLTSQAASEWCSTATTESPINSDRHNCKCSELEAENKELQVEILRLKRTIQHLEDEAASLKKRVLNYNNIKESNKLVSFYTGFPNAATFDALYAFLKEKASQLQCWKGKDTKPSMSCRREASNKPGLGSKLNDEEKFFLVLIRLKLGLPVQELGRLFGIAISTVSRIFTTWINFLYFELKELFPIPPLNSIRKAVPSQFVNFPRTTLLIDCTEIKIQRAYMLKNQRDTFSNYKHYNTFKFLIAVTPGGLICFVSPLYGGAVSDKHIVKDSKFLSLLPPGHSILADKGFEIEDILPPGVELNIPPKFFKKTLIQMPSSDVQHTAKIAAERVHVERAIQRIKTYGLLKKDIPLSLQDVAEQIVTVCTYLTNFKKALLKAK